MDRLIWFILESGSWIFPFVIFHIQVWGALWAPMAYGAYKQNISNKNNTVQYWCSNTSDSSNHKIDIISTSPKTN